MEEEHSKRLTPRHPRQVIDIFTWIHCYTSYVSVLASRYHGVVPELMAYLVTITRVSQDFSGLAWVRYDATITLAMLEKGKSFRHYSRRDRDRCKV